MVPSVYEDGKLYNVLPSGNKAPDETGNHNGYDQTRADFTFSRDGSGASKATRVNASGLIEKGRENYILHSQEIDNAYWNKAGFSVTANQATAPDGTLTADLIDDGTASGNHYIEENEEIGGGVTTVSIHAKYVDTQYLWLASYDTQYRIVVFDIQNGTIGNKSQTSLLPTIEDLGDGWYRCAVTHPTNTRSNPYISFGLRDDNVAAFETFTGANRQAYVWGAQLEKGLVATDYIESTTAAASAGLLGDMPRLDYSGGASSASLLLEPSRTNLVTQSEYFGGWQKIGAITTTPNYGTSPEGVKNSTRVQFSGASQEIRSSLGSVTGCVASIYVKGTSGQTIKFGTTGQEDLFTLNGNWQRIDEYNAGSPANITINTYSGATARDIEVWGAQLEAGSYPTSYIPTYGSAVAVAADSCTNTSATSVIGQTEGTMYAEFNWEQKSGVYFVSDLSTGSTSNEILIAIGNTADNRIRFQIQNGGVDQFNFNSSVISSGTHKVALAYKANDVVAYLDGVQVATDTSATIPATSQYRLERANGTLGFSGEIKQTMLFDTRLTNSELATLTTL